MPTKYTSIFYFTLKKGLNSQWNSVLFLYHLFYHHKFHFFIGMHCFYLLFGFGFGFGIHHNTVNFAIDFHDNFIGFQSGYTSLTGWFKTSEFSLLYSHNFHLSTFFCNCIISDISKKQKTSVYKIEHSSTNAKSWQKKNTNGFFLQRSTWKNIGCS